MSYKASNTPNPTSPIQIGYSMSLTANEAKSTVANITVSVSTTNSNIPIGVWIISGYSLTAGFSNATVATNGDCIISYSTGDVIAQSGFQSPAISYKYLNPTGIFYSDGTTDIVVKLDATTNSNIDYAVTRAFIKITKIA
jgi:hypothetical protein